MSFDTLAPTYLVMETMTAWRLLQRCRTYFLEQTHSRRRALLLGEGPGRFLLPLLQENPELTATCVDSSQGMIAVARKRLRRYPQLAERVEFEHADILTWTPKAAAYDLVATHFFLDCFPPDQIKQVVCVVAAASIPGARWLLSDFHEPAAGWQKWRAQAILRLMYAFFRPVTGLLARRLTRPDPYLSQSGFELRERRLENFGLVHSDLWERTVT